MFYCYQHWLGESLNKLKTMMNLIKVKGQQRSNLVNYVMATIFGQKSRWNKVKMMLTSKKSKVSIMDPCVPQYVHLGQTVEIISGALFIWSTVNGPKVNISAPVYQRAMDCRALVLSFFCQPQIKLNVPSSCSNRFQWNLATMIHDPARICHITLYWVKGHARSQRWKR